MGKAVDQELTVPEIEPPPHRHAGDSLPLSVPLTRVCVSMLFLKINLSTRSQVAISQWAVGL